MGKKRKPRGGTRAGWMKGMATRFSKALARNRADIDRILDGVSSTLNDHEKRIVKLEEAAGVSPDSVQE